MAYEENSTLYRAYHHRRHYSSFLSDNAQTVYACHAISGCDSPYDAGIVVNIGEKGEGFTAST